MARVVTETRRTQPDTVANLDVFVTDGAGFATEMEETASEDPGGGQVASDAFSITDTAAAVSGPTTNEPVFDSSIHTSVYFEDFETYANTAALKAAYATRETRGTINLDTSVAFSGSKSYRVDWQDPDGCPGDADVLIEKSVGMGVSECLLSLNFRKTTNYQWMNAPCGGNASKFFLANRTGASATMRVGLYATDEPAAPNIYGTLTGLRWCFVCEGGNGNPLVRLRQHMNDETSGTDVRPQTIGDLTWHRLTMRFVKSSGENVGDGIVQVWVDGLLVMDYDGSDSGDPAFGLMYMGTGPFGSPIQYPAVLNRSAIQVQSLWFDAVRMYRLTNP